MSDFFGDDFTAELKSYFLESLNKEADKFLDLIDDSNWQKIRSEFADHCLSWAADARTNEFTYLGQWLDVFNERSEIFNESKDVLSPFSAAFSGRFCRSGAGGNCP